MKSDLQQAARKGSLSALALGVIVAVVALFIGIYMISKVSDVASISNTSDFYDVYDSLVTDTGTIYDVLVLVIIVVSLGVVLAVLRRGLGAEGGGGSSAI